MSPCLENLLAACCPVILSDLTNYAVLCLLSTRVRPVEKYKGIQGVLAAAGFCSH